VYETSLVTCGQVISLPRNVEPHSLIRESTPWAAIVVHDHRRIGVPTNIPGVYRFVLSEGSQEDVWLERRERDPVELSLVEP
jgi:hypothetical protein